MTTCFGPDEVRELLASGHDILTTNFEVLNLTEDLRAELDQHTIQPLLDVSQLDLYHRLLIYTDGSSVPAMRRMPPERADELGHPDAWSFVVIGEEFVVNFNSKLTILGWTSQPVRYTPGGSAYTGMQRTCSDLAERSALIAAACWRLSLDHAIATVFCSDSLQSGGQAQGTIGIADPDESFYLLRILFQALELASPSDHLALHHTRAHAGDLFNEIADTAAKQEASDSDWISISGEPGSCSSGPVSVTNMDFLNGGMEYLMSRRLLCLTSARHLLLDLSRTST